MEGHDAVWLHTNHVLDEEMAQTCRVPDGSSSLWRREKLEKMKAHNMPTTMAGLWASFDDVSMAIPEDKPHHSSTCGAVVMNLKTSTMWACKGLPRAADPLVLPTPENP